ncbi:hypothetical protein BDP27DRAFT_1314467 [Rhodocollybia butyracea]|uniref:Uncharacterized protein n=1 Tax=Rhodocollybia butyracea TaxID=206335 RepID=A0A9P5Q5F4_9AGAR|nr:hypothetical protein BDP27DRAFT_1314467 [Rhodocollybia butyracea]
MKLGRLDLGPLKGKGNWEAKSVNCMEFSPHGSFLACGTHDGLWVWNAKTGEEVFTFTDPNPEFVESLVFSPDEKILFCGFRSWMSGHWKCTAQVTQNQNGLSVQILRIPYWQVFGSRCIAVSPTGRYLAYLTGEHPPALHFIDHNANPTPMLLAIEEDSRITSLRIAMPFGGHDSLWEKGDDDSGWIYGPNKELLAWVPPELRKGLNWNSRVSGDAHGTSWVNCLVESELHKKSPT